MQTYRHTNIQTYRHTGIQTYRHTGIQTHRHACKCACTQTYIHITSVLFNSPSRNMSCHSNSGRPISKGHRKLWPWRGPVDSQRCQRNKVPVKKTHTLDLHLKIEKHGLQKQIILPILHFTTPTLLYRTLCKNQV